MNALLDHRLLFVTGKGGVGKTSVAAALALLAARTGRRTLVCSMDAKNALAAALDTAELAFRPRELEPNLFGMNMNTEDALREYLRLFVHVPLVGRIGPLARTFDFVADAAPGVKEILGVGKLAYEVRERHYDLVVVDAEASGHIVAQVGAPRVIRELVQVGMVRDQTRWMLEILEDPACSGVVVVTTPEEMPVNETIELLARLAAETRVAPLAIVANRVLPARFDRRQSEVVEHLGDAEDVLVEACGAGRPPGGAGRAAHRGPPARREPPLGTPAGGDAARSRGALRPGAVHQGDGPARRRARRRGARRGTGRRLMAATKGARGVSLDALLASKEMILVCGSGGVGKTTIAAALGLDAVVNQGGKVLVLTVDPARRLADAMGIGALGNQATRVPTTAFAEAGVEPRGELWAAMLDTKAGWDELIRRHAPDPAVRDSVLSNPLYQNITSHFVHSHDYLAMEQLHEVHASGDYDLVVVDTPPSRNALDVLDAPSRMIEFFGSRLLKWLTMPYRSRLFNVASKPFNQIADRVLGSHFLQDIAQFFVLFQAMEHGFVAHAREVEALLGDPRTVFVVVSTLEAAPAHEAGQLARELVEREFQLGAIIANRVMPAKLTSKAAAASARKLAEAVERGPFVTAVSGALAAEGTDVDPRAVHDVLQEVAGRFHEIALVATRESERRAELAALAPHVLDVETLPSDVHDLGGLLSVVGFLRA